MYRVDVRTLKRCKAVVNGSGVSVLITGATHQQVTQLRSWLRKHCPTASPERVSGKNRYWIIWFKNGDGLRTFAAEARRVTSYPEVVFAILREQISEATELLRGVRCGFFETLDPGVVILRVEDGAAAIAVRLACTPVSAILQRG